MKNPVVSVAILNDDKIKFELHGDFKLSGTERMCNGKFVAQLVNGKITLSHNGETLEINPYDAFVPQDPEDNSIVVRDVLIGIDFHWEQRKTQRYKGSLKFVVENNKLTAINELHIEDYLISVISSEMSATGSIELLKAHAIISRSWLISQIERRQSTEKETPKEDYLSKSDTEIIKWYDREDHTLYDVCADDHCQRYQGITKLFAHNAQDAVEQTRGMVLTYDGKICDARFSKSCGGISEAFEFVWEPVEHPYLKPVIDYKYSPDEFDTDLRIEENAERWIRNSPPAFCNTTDERALNNFLVDYDRETRDFYRWQVTYTQEELAEIIKQKSGIDFGQILKFEPVERGYSGRLVKLKIVGTKREMIIGKELEIRKYLSPTHLYSSAIVFDEHEKIDGVPRAFTIIGAGWGHGVGLCQIGAAVMSDQGYMFDEILAHYFVNSKITKLY